MFCKSTVQVLDLLCLYCFKRSPINIVLVSDPNYGISIFQTIRQTCIKFSFVITGLFFTGMYTESSSDGFLIDKTGPIFTKPLGHVPIGSLLPYTTLLRSSLSVQWKVDDDESFINKQYLSVAAHRGDSFIATAKVSKSIDHSIS